MINKDLTYFPPPESEGGWRVPADSDETRAVAGVDPDAMEAAWDYNRRSRGTSESDNQAALNPQDNRMVPEAGSSAVVVIRRGCLVGEWYQNADASSRWNIHSCTKSFTGTAFGMLFEDSRNGRLPSGRKIELDSPAYDYIREGHPLSDPRKADITVRHLLSMTSGIRGENTGIFGHGTSPGVGPFEMALGFAPTDKGESTAQLAGDPGTLWDYSDPAFDHLSLIFLEAAGVELEEYMQRRVFSHIGLHNYQWDRLGGEGGNIGPHTMPNSGLNITARELSRFGYLLLSGGQWSGRAIVPRAWVELSTRSSQNLNRDYGMTWWTNAAGTLWPGLPNDAFAAMGFLGNKCYVIPSLDLVVVRIADGPWPWDDLPFLTHIVKSVF